MRHNTTNMQKVITRLLIKLPLHIINYLACATILIPILFWLLFKKDMLIYIFEKIENIA